MEKKRPKVIAVIADHTTPKIGGGRTAYTINERDHKGEMVVVLSEQDRDIEPGSAPRKL
jgi:hypothetical protein